MPPLGRTGGLGHDRAGDRWIGAVRLTPIAIDIVAVIALFPRLLHTVSAAWSNGRVDTPGIGVARVRRAGLCIIAGDRITATIAVGAKVIFGASIAVVTRSRVGGIDATRLRIAGIIGADVVVVAVECLSGQAGSIRADILYRTQAAVIARVGVVDMDTTHRDLTAIGGADIVVITIEFLAAHADAAAAHVDRGARVAIVAWR